VGHGKVNVLQGSSIGLTSYRLAAVDRPVGTPASSGGAPAGSSTTVREWPGLIHVLHGELPCDPGKVPGRSRGLGKRRGSELDGGGSAAAAEARAPAKGWLSLINTCLMEVLWFTGKGWSSWVCEEIGWSTVLTGRRQWRTAAARVGMRAREGRRALAYKHTGRSVG
jgi:hypothetical protein